MAENIDIFDFALDEEDMLEIMKLDKSSSLFFDHTNPDIVEWFDEMVEDGKNRQ
jgi:2,5-diketo-D-gluconate reductase A